jgi:DNA-binding MarR family transcriptional regulator
MGTELGQAMPDAAQAGPVSHAIFRVARAHKALAAELLRELGLHAGQELLLMYLWQMGPSKQADLATEFNTDSASMTRTVQRLERAGFVRRRPSLTDGRVTLVECTAAGRRLRPRIEQMWARLERQTVESLSSAARACLLSALEAVERNLLTRA